MTLTSIDNLNRLSGPDFQHALRPLFETVVPLAQALERGKPYATYTALLNRAEAILPALAEAEQVEVLNAHPRIGARKLSALSYREQGYDRQADDPAVLQELAVLNEAYEVRFGFRFVVFVNHRSKSEILPVLRQRLERSRAQELATARHALVAIARDRLRAVG